MVPTSISSDALLRSPYSVLRTEGGAARHVCGSVNDGDGGGRSKVQGCRRLHAHDRCLVEASRYLSCSCPGERASGQVFPAEKAMPFGKTSLALAYLCECIQCRMAGRKSAPRAHAAVAAAGRSHADNVGHSNTCVRLRRSLETFHANLALLPRYETYDIYGPVERPSRCPQ